MIKKAATSLLIVLFSSSVLIGLGQGIRIDHVITVVADLDSAVKAYEERGFTIKQGRLHENGLLNAHIKFKNNTAVEFMSITGVPTDKVAKEYARLLNSGEGGVYLAITGISIDELVEKLNGLGIKYNRIPGKSWDYITFPRNSRLAHIFFIDYHIKTNKSTVELTHNNSAKGIEAVWIDGDQKVRQLLENLGLKPVRLRSELKLGAGQGYRTGAGNIIVVPPKNPNLRPRIRAISFGKENNTENLIILY